LGINVFDYGQKAAADQMRTSWEKLVQYVGTSYGSDISNELRNKSEVILQQPTHDTTVIARHLTRETMVRAGQLNLQAAREAQRAALQADINAGTNDPDAPLKLAMMQNDIAQGDFEAMEPVPMVLTDTEKTSQSNAWRSYRERNASLLKHRGQVYSLIL
jgi:regulator of protease activity HflC (stomatin/prohibitin superfamily)